jgi:hypothetical protein
MRYAVIVGLVLALPACGNGNAGSGGAGGSGADSLFLPRSEHVLARL